MSDEVSDEVIEGLFGSSENNLKDASLKALKNVDPEDLEGDEDFFNNLGGGSSFEELSEPKKEEQKESAIDMMDEEIEEDEADYIEKVEKDSGSKKESSSSALSGIDWDEEDEEVEEVSEEEEVIEDEPSEEVDDFEEISEPETSSSKSTVSAGALGEGWDDYDDDDEEAVEEEEEVIEEEVEEEIVEVEEEVIEEEVEEESPEPVEADDEELDDADDDTDNSDDGSDHVDDDVVIDDNTGSSGQDSNDGSSSSKSDGYSTSFDDMDIDQQKEVIMKLGLCKDISNLDKPDYFAFYKDKYYVYCYIGDEGESLDYDKLKRELRKMTRNINVDEDRVLTLDEFNLKIQQLQSYRNRVTEIKANAISDFILKKKMVAHLQNSLFKYSDQKSKEKREGEVLQHMPDMCRISIDANRFYDFVDLYYKNLESAHESLSRQVTIIQEKFRRIERREEPLVENHKESGEFMKKKKNNAFGAKSFPKKEGYRDWDDLCQKD